MRNGRAASVPRDVHGWSTRGGTPPRTRVVGSAALAPATILIAGAGSRQRGRPRVDLRDGAPPRSTWSIRGGPGGVSGQLACSASWRNCRLAARACSASRIRLASPAKLLSTSQRPLWDSN